MPVDQIPPEFDPDRMRVLADESIGGDVNQIAPLVRRIMDAIREVGCAEGREADIELALTEALANAVVHGCGSDPDKRVECAVACDDENGVLIVVRDPGKGFDPHDVPSPIVGRRVFSTHGRGIFLINQLMDAVHYVRGGAEIRMRKK